MHFRQLVLWFSLLSILVCVTSSLTEEEKLSDEEDVRIDREAEKGFLFTSYCV